MASIDSLDFVKKSYYASYGTAKKDYYGVKTDIDIIALRPSISTNEPIMLIIVAPKTILVSVVETVELNSIDMFKWFHPTKVDYVRDRLTFYGFKENKNMYFTSIAGSSNNFTFPRDKISFL
jgi:hypothetical protein